MGPMTIYWMFQQALRPVRWCRALLRYHFGPGDKVEVGFSGDVPEELAGKTYRGRLHNSVLTTRLNLRTSPRAGTIVRVIDRNKS
jgi:hypothetical protein